MPKENAKPFYVPETYLSEGIMCMQGHIRPSRPVLDACFPHSGTVWGVQGNEKEAGPSLGSSPAVFSSDAHGCQGAFVRPPGSRCYPGWNVRCHRPPEHRQAKSRPDVYFT